VVVLRELEIEGLRLAGRHAARRVVEFLQHATFADREDEVLRRAALERLAVDRALEVHRQPVAVLRGALRRLELRALLAQDFQRLVEREVKKRVEAKVKEQALQALLGATPLEIPKSLVAMEANGMAERAVADLKARGIDPQQVPLNPQAFEEAAKRRVALGLIIAELARSENLQPKPAEVRALVEQEAQSYESPAEVVKWFYMQPQRLSEMEALALETNVVKWVLTKAKVLDKQVTFDELMGGAGS
jgi:FKBP-type peptidyl-prolyl cis-trans isomerase (trigger factor)